MDAPLVPANNAPTPAVEEKWPVSELEFILEACAPDEALQHGDKRYANLKELRHGIGITRFEKTLSKRPPKGQFHHGLLCGHRGSGKSTELLALKQWADTNGFLTEWEEVNERFGMIELDYSDVFLLAATMAEKAMAGFGHPLPPEKVRPVIEWFRDIIQEDTQEYKSEIGAEVGGQLEGRLPLGLGKLFAKVTAAFKGTTTHTRKVRDTFRKYPETLIDYTTSLLDAANKILTARGKPHGLLLLFDNMDRYDPTLIDNILVRSSDQVRRLACHAIFTFPIALTYRPISGKVTSNYPACVTLPMLAIRKQSDGWSSTVATSGYEEAKIAILRETLQQRIRLETLFADQNDVTLLIKMSGGSIRDLIQLVANAATYTEDENRITSEAVQEAIRDLREVYIRLLRTTPQDYRCLAAIARRVSIVTEVTDYGETLNRLLFNGSLLEYGAKGESWLDVHPILIETREFRDALAAQK